MTSLNGVYVISDIPLQSCIIRIEDVFDGSDALYIVLEL